MAENTNPTKDVTSVAAPEQAPTSFDKGKGKATAPDQEDVVMGEDEDDDDEDDEEVSPAYCCFYILCTSCNPSRT